MSLRPVTVIGAGLAGSEAAWQIAKAGVPVVLKEMRPRQTTPAHKTGLPAELVCSNSLRSDDRNDGNKRPQLSDLRESGAIEQDADIVCFIHRPEYYTRSTTDAENRDIRGMAEFIVAKHRSGSVDDIEMTFVARFARFQNRSEPMPFEKGTMASKINDDPGPQEVYIPAPADGQPNAVDASAMGLGNDAQGGPMPDFLSE